jgi:ubiquinone/menaquinone biosynthesis C-methylase UbiE
MTENISQGVLAKQALEVWETNAQCWDDTMRAGGNDYWTALEMPALRQMVELKEGENALDLATGNGLVARWLIEEGCSTVLATDGSMTMIDYALKRTSEWAKTDGNRHEGKVVFEHLNLVDHDEIDRFVRKECETKVS